MLERGAEAGLVLGKEMCGAVAVERVICGCDCGWVEVCCVAVAVVRFEERGLYSWVMESLSDGMGSSAGA